MAARRILIVEDETMIAMMVEDFLRELGWDVVGWAGGSERAIAMARDADIDAEDVTVFPTELPLVAKEQPAQPESKPIIRRPRIKNEISFKDRLMKSAQDARERAARLPPGPASERLLLKAMQSETAADIDAWAATPGSAPPKSLDQVKKPKH